jgi:hypothetical protein
MAASRSFVATRCPFSKNAVAVHSSAAKRSLHVKHNSVTRLGPSHSDAMVPRIMQKALTTAAPQSEFSRPWWEPE